MTERQLLIGGEWVDGADGGYDVINPATEEIVGIAPEASPGQALDAARAAQEAFPEWSQTTPEHRSELMQRAAEAIKARFKDLLPTVIAETGCTATVGKHTRERIRQIEAKALRKLRHPSRSRRLKPFLEGR